jgi:hypothetical protein
VAIATRPNQSALLQWLLCHHAEFAAGIPATGQPGWRRIATALTDSGFTKRDGSPIDADYARQTWWKVRRKLQARQPIAPPAPPTPHRRLVTTIPIETTQRRQFTAAKIKE